MKCVDIVEQLNIIINMNNEYIIISKTAIQQRIDELEKELKYLKGEYAYVTLGEINSLNKVLSQSTPLIPEIEKAVTEGVNSIHFENDGSYWEDENVVEDYISNLKLDI